MGRAVSADAAGAAGAGGTVPRPCGRRTVARRRRGAGSRLALLALLALGGGPVAGVRADDAAPAAPPRPATPPPPPPAVPAPLGVPTSADPWLAHGLSAAARVELRGFCADAVVRGDVAGGALLVAHRGEVVFREAFGLADRARKMPFAVDTPCRIASISKAFVATLCARLATRGALDLDAPIDRWLPEFRGVRLESGVPSPRVPRLRECLAHTAGFTADEEPGGRPWLATRAGTWTLAEQVASVAARGLARAPGERFAYSGTGIDVVGRVVEVATKRDLSDAIEAELFAPLGLGATTYVPSPEVVARIPVYHFLWESDGRLHADRTSHVFPPKGQYRSVGGGIVSTLDDVHRFLGLHRARGALAGAEFVAPAIWRELVTAHPPARRYGLGWSLEPGARADGLPSKLRHSGSTGTAAWVDFDHDVVGVILTQGHRVAGGKATAPARTIAPTEPEFPKVLEERVDAIVAGLSPADAAGR